jgi:hypothetical protein
VWAVSEELIRPEQLTALRTVGGLRAGRSNAAESEPRKPIDPANVEAIAPHAGSRVAAMMRLELLSGMRPGEVCDLTMRGLDMSGKVWGYTPATHMTSHHGHSRTIYLGPQSQEILRP